MRKVHSQTAEELLEQYRQGIIIKEQALEGLCAILNRLHDDVELLLFRAEQVREAQHKYFKNRTETDKKLSIAMEGQLDQLLTQYKRRGYITDVLKLQAAKQRKLL